MSFWHLEFLIPLAIGIVVLLFSITVLHILINRHEFKLNPVVLSNLIFNTLYASTCLAPLLLRDRLSYASYFNEFLIEIRETTWIIYYLQILLVQISLFIVAIFVVKINRHAPKISYAKKVNNWPLFLLCICFIIIYDYMGIFDYIYKEGIVSYIGTRTLDISINDSVGFTSTLFEKIKDVLLPVIGIMIIYRTDGRMSKILLFMLISLLLLLGLKKYPLMFFMAAILIMIFNSAKLKIIYKYTLFIIFSTSVFSIYAFIMLSQGNEEFNVFSPILRVLLTPHTSALSKYYFYQNNGFIGAEYINDPDFLINITKSIYGIGFGDTGNFLSLSWLQGGISEFIWQLCYFNILIFTYSFLVGRVKYVILRDFCLIVFIYSLFPLLSVDIYTWAGHYLIKWCILLMISAEFYNLLIVNNKNNNLSNVNKMIRD